MVCGVMNIGGIGLTYDYVVMFKYQYHLLVISNSILSFIQYHLFFVLTQLTFNS